MKNKFYIFFIAFFFINSSCNKENVLNLSFKDNLDRNDFKIELEIIYSTPKLTIFDDGVINKIPDGYGENDWIIIYKDSICGKFRHFKTSDDDKHTYYFEFYKKNNSVYCDINIVGVSELKQLLKLDLQSCSRKNNDINNNKKS